jgi:hypothetical protein
MEWRIRQRGPLVNQAANCIYLFKQITEKLRNLSILLQSFLCWKNAATQKIKSANAALHCFI